MRAPTVVAVALAAIIPGPTLADEGYVVGITGALAGRSAANYAPAVEPDAEAKTVALSKAESWKRVNEFPQELVTLPGETYPSSALVTACYALLAPKSAALQ
jgi:hypothetical protein